MTPATLLRSSSLRIALLYASLFIAAVVMVLALIYATTVGYMDAQTDAVLESDARGLLRQYEREGVQGLSRTIAERVAQHPDGEVVYLLADAELRPLAGNLDAWPAAPVADDGSTEFLLADWDYEHETRPARALTARLPDGLSLLVGRDVGDREQVRRLIRRALLGAFALTVIIALGIGVLVSSRVTGRLEKLNRTAREIMQGDLSRRVPTDSSGDDFDQLGTNLNRMLERIQALMTTVQQISNDVAHDLRKPLTRLRHRLEEARDADPADARQSLEQATREADDLMATFNALLRIANVESGQQRSAFVDVDPGALLADVGELYEPMASERGQSLEVRTGPSSIVRADRDLLFQALANLVDNAVKYTPAGGSIRLTLEPRDDGVCVAVADTGPGIPAELRNKVFERFYRVDASRSTPGNGLGLSLVRAIADLHGAEIRLLDNAPGLRVELILINSSRGAQPATHTKPGTTLSGKG